MTYKIANIKWLRDQGWSISSSYASGFCPTYNEIVNEIPKGSTTVNVNETCIATSKAYTNNQLVCESDITIGQAVDCSKYGFTANTISEAPSVANSQQLAFSIASEGVLTATVVEGSDVVTGITAPTAGPNYQYIGWFAENQSTSPKHAKIRYTSSDGCEWEQTVTQKGAVDCDAYWANINFNKYEQNIPSGGGDWLIGSTTEDKEQLNYTYDEGGLIEDVYDLIDPSSHVHVYIGHYAANTSSSSKSASITFISQDGNCQSATTVTQKGVVDCTKYQFEDMSPTIDVSGTGLNYPTVAKTSLEPNIGSPLSYLTSSTWITYQGTREEYSPDKFLYKISCSQNDGYAKTGSITFTNNDGCTFTATVSQEGVSSYIATLTLNNGSTVDIEGSGSLVQSMIEPYRSTVVNADIKSTCSSLASDSFASCSSLTSVTIPSSVYLIGDNSFEGCINLTSITIPNGVGIITSLVFGRCSRLTSVTISNTVTSIGLGAFSNCRGLTSITFPSSITEIGRSVLAGCSGIGKITCNATTPPRLGITPFDDTHGYIFVPSASVETYKSASGWSTYASRIRAIQ